MTACIVGAVAALVMLACASTDSPDGMAAKSGEAYSEQELVGVDVVGDGEETVITLLGLENPAYSAVKNEEENTLVIELRGVEQVSKSAFAALSGSSTQVAVYDGLVDQVSTSTYAGEDWPVTRVEIAFATAAEYEVVPTSDGLTVWISAGELASEDTDGEPSDDYAADELNADSDEYADAAEGEELAIEETGDAKEFTGASEDLAAAEAHDPWATAEPMDGEESDSVGDIEVTEEAASAVAMVPAEPPTPATALQSVAVSTTEAGVLVHLGANGMIAAAESFTLENPDRLVIDLLGMTNTYEKNKIPVEGDRVVRLRVGEHPGKLRVVLDGGPEANAFDGRRVIPAMDGLYVTVGTGSDLDDALSAALRSSNSVSQRVAASEAPGLAPMDGAESTSSEIEEIAAEESLDIRAPVEFASDETLPSDDADWTAKTESADLPAAVAWNAEPAMSGAAAWDEASAAVAPSTITSVDVADVPDVEIAEIYGLQYDRDEERDRIAVLSDQTIDYELHAPDDETLVISIKNAMITEQAAERITPKLGGPVSLVSTFQQPDVAHMEVRLVIKRAPGLQPQIMRRGSLLFLDFANTGVAAAPPPAFIQGEVGRQGKEEYANELSVSQPGEGQLADAGDPMAADVAEPEVPVTASGEAADGMDVQAEPNESYAALPQFDEPAALDAANDAPDWDAAAVPVSVPLGEGPPASLEPPAAVEILEEGGLIDGKEYEGRRISLDFKDVEISDVLRLIAEVSDLNIIAGDEVAGTITIRLVDVPWDQALDVILLTKGLGFVRVGNVLRIAPAEILKVEEEVRLQERRNKEKLEDLEVKLQPVNYAAVKDIAELVRRLLSPRGTVNTDARTNTLIIKDISSVIDEATALIQAIDTQTPQVMIEAKIVEANLEFARELGSTWAVGTQRWNDGFNPGDSPRTDLGNENFRFQGENSVIFGNPITAVPTGMVNFGAFLLDDKMRVDVQIQAMEATGEGKVISSPRIVTLDNREALIEQGVSIPFQTFEGGDAKLEFIDAVLSLKVTPHITTDKSIIMKLEVTRNAPDSSVSTPTGSPAIAKNQAQTETLVKDGQTLVIGGIYTVDKTTRDTRVPYLHRIPVLGAAFKSKEVSDVRKELLIFVTPRIVVNPELAAN